MGTDFGDLDNLTERDAADAGLLRKAPHDKTRCMNQTVECKSCKMYYCPICSPNGCQRCPNTATRSSRPK